MTPRGNIFLWLVATAAMAALTSWIIANRSPFAGGRGGNEIGNTQVLSASPLGKADQVSDMTLHEWMHRQLDLSPAQHAVLAPLESAYETDRVRLREAITAIGAELAVAMRDDAPEATVFEIQHRLHAAQGALQEATLKHFIAMRRQLTERQAREFALWTHDSLLLTPSN